MRFILILGVLAMFGLYSSWVLWTHGYVAIWQAGMANAPALQVLLDLVIACALISAWMVGDARARGLNPWPFVAVTLAAGSFGPLFYLLWRERRVATPALA